jgi:YebC/PmpR family DNA-binding regulatory protein
VKYKKEVADAKKGKAFSKMARMITIAAREGGADPEMNPKLRLAIEKARFINMPKENIERAIKRGVGDLEGAVFEEILLEAYGPGGIAILIEGITDNKNRTLAEIKQILSQNGGKLVGEGAVRWMFERKGVISVDPQKSALSREELEMKAIEAGAEDIFWHNQSLDIYTKIEDLEKVKKNLEDQKIEIESASLDFVAKEQIEIPKQEKERVQKLFEALDENEAVQEIYSNLKTIL